MRKPALAAAAAVAALAAVTTTGTPALAGQKPKLDVTGAGSYTVAADGSAVVTGSVTGFPVDGTYVATLAAADGSLPEPGETELATGTIRIVDARGAVVELTGTSEVEGTWPQEGYVVTHVFYGRYTVTDTSVRRLRETDGWFEIRLGTEGRASVTAIDT